MKYHVNNNAERHHIDLPIFLDYIISKNSRPPGFTGTVVVGVRGHQVSRFLVAVFIGERVTTYLENNIENVNFDLLLAFDEETEQAFLDKTLDAGKVSFAGSQMLKNKFLGHYFGLGNVLNFRLSKTH